MVEIAADTSDLAGKKPPSLRTVVAASAAGTTFEWYDFFVFGSLIQVISKTFFSGLPETAGYIAALALFGAGFAFRPLGALVFGRIGDKAGRKGAFLITVVLMGGATFAIGLLPTYAQAGLIAPKPGARIAAPPCAGLFRRRRAHGILARTEDRHA